MTKPVLELDLECYPDWFLAKFRWPNGEYEEHHRTREQELDYTRIESILANCQIITFNGNNYDVPMLAIALTGVTNEQLKEANDDIIVRRMKWWQVLQKHGIRDNPDWDHIDIMEPLPGVRMGLKLYMARAHCELIQDLPFNPDDGTDPARIKVLAKYCGNDLDGTHELATIIKQRLALREQLSDVHGVDLRSKSDAQMAESIMRAKLPYKPRYRYIPHGYSFKYQPAPYLRFDTPELNRLLADSITCDFVVTDKEEATILYGDAEGIRTGVVLPKELAGRKVTIGVAKYKLGIGGLHSQEESVSHYADDDTEIWDIDVRSYYPSLILSMGMEPEALQGYFTPFYKGAFDARVSGKIRLKQLEHNDNLTDATRAEMLRLKLEDASNKILLNGTFGKLFSKFSIFCAPELGIRVTLSGQLALLMLIEKMEAGGIRVLSANTDGVVVRVPKSLKWFAESTVKWWEKTTGLEMEYAHYKSIHQRDVNNYVAITTDGEVKRKGVFVRGGVMVGTAGKTPDKDVVAEAVIAQLTGKCSIREHVMRETDMRRFVVVRQAKGGAMWRDQFLGKVARWYHGSKDTDSIVYATNGNRVAGSEGSRPAMRLPPFIPFDLDREFYIKEAESLLRLVGAQ